MLLLYGVVLLLFFVLFSGMCFFLQKVLDLVLEMVHKSRALGNWLDSGLRCKGVGLLRAVEFAWFWKKGLD